MDQVQRLTDVGGVQGQGSRGRVPVALSVSDCAA